MDILGNYQSNFKIYSRKIKPENKRTKLCFETMDG